MREKKVDIVSVAFNKPELIRTQIRLVEKYLRDTYDLVIVDNSTDDACSASIAEICRSAGVRYVESGSEPSNPSMSHGLCLNWAYRNVIQPSPSRYFGTIDHDIFPIRPTSIIPNLGSGLYGLLQHVSPWYLWPGFSFFDKEFVEEVVPGSDLDFRPIPGLDTGGGNWPILYSKIDVSLVTPPAGYEMKRLREGDSHQLAHYVMMGDWLHMINGSSWVPDLPGTEPKADLVFKILEELEDAR
jgi:hypothetical protein